MAFGWLVRSFFFSIWEASVMRSTLRVIAAAVCRVAIVLSVAPVYAGPVPLPFFEDFSTDSADVVVDPAYAHFTHEGQERTITVEEGILVMPMEFGPQPTYYLTVTPDPMPTGEVIINIDMGARGTAGVIACRLRLGNNAMVFHPGIEEGVHPRGAFRIEGPGGFPNTAMTFTPAVGVLHHAEIHSFPDGLFTIKITDGSDPNNVYEDMFTNIASYGGRIGPGFFSGGSSIYDNLSITVAGSGGQAADFDSDGDVDATDLGIWQSSYGVTNGGDADDDGDSDGADFLIWQRQLGTLPSTVAAAAVPEPGAIGLLGIGIAAISAVSGWRRRR